ncbi:hypothetical protein KM043_004652 [Ampulex compressa]|nr:hypothetical protein KM043_004652 [Ampulex compressa]
MWQRWRERWLRVSVAARPMHRAAMQSLGRGMPSSSRLERFEEFLTHWPRLWESHSRRGLRHWYLLRTLMDLRQRSREREFRIGPQSSILTRSVVKSRLCGKVTQITGSGRSRCCLQSSV